MKRVLLVMMLAAATACVQANIVVDPGFEDLPLGVIPDGSAPDTWVSWNGNFEATADMVRSGDQAVKIGVKDLVNVVSGDKYSNLRYEYEVTDPAIELDSTTWIGSAWIYYDASNGSSTDAFSFVVKARDNWNTAVVESRLSLSGSDLVSGQWNYIEAVLDVPAQNLDPLDPDYANKLRNRITLNFEQNGWIGETGDFYADDVSLSVVPEPMTLILLGLGGMVLRRRS